MALVARARSAGPEGTLTPCACTTRASPSASRPTRINMLKTGKLGLNVEKFSLKELILELCEEQKNLSRDLIITCRIEDLPNEVELDRKMMTIVLTNLLSNAVKFSPENPIIQVHGRTNGGRVFVTVEDNGVGIPEEEVDRIFERFFRATTSSGIAGSGVGLSLVRDLVKLQGGHIQAKSQVGKGTSLSLELPESLSKRA